MKWGYVKLKLSESLGLHIIFKKYVIFLQFTNILLPVHVLHDQ